MPSAAQTKPEAPALTPFDGKPRRIKVTCRYPDCGHSQETWTRWGRHFTCDRCHRRQEGPAEIHRLLAKKAAKSSPAAIPVTVVAVSNGHRRAEKPKVVKQAAPPPVAAAPTPPAPPPAPKRDIVSRIMGFP